MFGSTKEEEVKPPSEAWYQFTERAELETESDAGAGYGAEGFLPSFWAAEEPDNHSNESAPTSAGDNGGGFMWFLTGLGFGALLGVLYAPHSGRETRRVIRSTAEEAKDYIRVRSRDAREAVDTWVDRGKEVINRQKDQFSSAYEAGRQPYHEASGAEGTKKS